MPLPEGMSSFKRLTACLSRRGRIRARSRSDFAENYFSGCSENIDVAETRKYLFWVRRFERVRIVQVETNVFLGTLV